MNDLDVAKTELKVSWNLTDKVDKGVAVSPLRPIICSV